MSFRIKYKRHFVSSKEKMCLLSVDMENYILACQLAFGGLWDKDQFYLLRSPLWWTCLYSLLGLIISPLIFPVYLIQLLFFFLFFLVIYCCVTNYSNMWWFKMLLLMSLCISQAVLQSVTELAKIWWSRMPFLVGLAVVRLVGLVGLSWATSLCFTWFLHLGRLAWASCRLSQGIRRGYVTLSKYFFCLCLCHIC